MHSLQGWSKQFDFGQVKLSGVCGLFGRETVLRAVWACPQKDFTEVFLQRFKNSLPGSVQCLIVVYRLCAIYNEQKNISMIILWHSQSGCYFT